MSKTDLNIFTNLIGRIGHLTIVAAPYVKDDTIIVSQNTYEAIKAMVPDANIDIVKEVKPCDHIWKHKVCAAGMNVWGCSKCGAEKDDYMNWDAEPKTPYGQQTKAIFNKVGFGPVDNSKSDAILGNGIITPKG